MDRLKSPLQAELPWNVRVGITCSIAVATSVYLHALPRYTKPALLRWCLGLPVLVINLWLPLLFDSYEELLTRTSVVFMLAWLGSFKTLALCMNRGPLLGTQTLAQTAALYLLPVYPKQVHAAKAGRLADDSSGAMRLLQFAVRNLLILSTAAYLLVALELPTVVKQFAYAFGLYGFITFLMDGPAALASSALGIPLIPCFDEPWLSTSVADFWGRRWNIPTASMLRCCVYDPVMEGRLVALPLPRTKVGLARKAAAACATMAVSGVVHEIIFAYIAPIPPTGKWMAFFTMQGPLMLVEQQVAKAASASGLKMPRLLATLATLALLEGCAALFFFPPVDSDTDIAPRVSAAVVANIKVLMERWGSG